MEPASERQAAHYYFIQETTIEGWKRRGRAPEYRAALDFGAWLALNVYNVDAAAGLLQVCGLLASEKNGSGFLGFLKSAPNSDFGIYERRLNIQASNIYRLLTEIGFFRWYRRQLKLQSCFI